ncbi:MAG: glycerophosphodiester phosphodiesterase family protein [Lacipirellulaceae bacterium]
MQHPDPTAEPLDDATRRPPAVGWATAVGASNDLRRRWRELLVAGVSVRVVSALVLAPFYSVLLRVAVGVSGQPVLTDEELLTFIVSPIGMAGLVVVGVAAVALVALEVAVLLTVVAQTSPSVVGAATLALSNTVTVLRVATRVVLHALAWLAPAGLAAWLTHATLLSEFDVNYYLAERPWQFGVAVAIACVIVTYAAWLAVRVATEWSVALPLVLFEGVSPAQAHRASMRRTAPARWAVRTMVVGWFVASFAFSTLATAFVAAAIWPFAAVWPRSLSMVALGAGLSIAALAGVTLLTTVVGTASFAAVVYRLHRALGGQEPASSAAPRVSQPVGFGLTRPRAFAAGGVALLASTTAGFVALGSVPVEDHVVVIGHRGAPRAAPENTLAAIRAAIEGGADYVEVDVQESADGEVIVFHDSDFMKAAGLGLKVWDATREDLAAIDVGARRGERFRGERVPTLAQVLDLCRDRVGVLVELKYYGHDIDLERRVVDVVERAGAALDTMFMSLRREGVAKLKGLRPHWRVGLLMSVAVGDQRGLKADFLAVNASFVTRGVLRSARRSGREVYAWTVNDPLTISSIVGRGIDGVITDEPGVAKRVLRERAEIPPVARLLVELADRFRIATGARPTAGVPAADVAR